MDDKEKSRIDALYSNRKKYGSRTHTLDPTEINYARIILGRHVYGEGLKFKETCFTESEDIQIIYDFVIALKEKNFERLAECREAIEKIKVEF